MKKNNSKKIALIGLLTALAIVLKMIAIYIFTNNRIVFHNIPIMIVSLAFGPVYGVISAIIADIASVVVTAGWNPLFTIPQIFWGLIPGLLGLLFKKKNVKNIVVIEIITYLTVSIANLFIMSIVYSPEVALGIVKKEKDLIIGFEFFKSNFSINLGKTYYLGILIKLFIMAIKMPLDIFILHKLFKRFSDKLEVEYA